MKHAAIKKKPAIVAAPKAKKYLPTDSAKTVVNGAKKANVSTVQPKLKKQKPAIVVALSKAATVKPGNAVEKDTVAPNKARATSARSTKAAKSEIFAEKNEPAAKSRASDALKKTKTAAPKTSVSVRKNAALPLSSAVVAKKSKNTPVQPVDSTAGKNKSAGAAISARGKVEIAPEKPVAIDSKRKNKSVKSLAVVVAKEIKPAKLQPIVAPLKAKKAEPKRADVKKKPANVQSDAPVKTSEVPVKESKIASRRIKSAVADKTLEIAPAVRDTNDIQSQKIFAAVKIRRQKIVFAPKIASAGKIQLAGNGKSGKTRGRGESETVESSIEPVEAAVAEKPKKRKAKAIGAAVFRGRRERYDFQVFPLDSEFDAMSQVSGIYVISKRKTDRNKRAHHALVCIGQTDSVAGEIKRHQKKCIKKHQANVISILPEGDAKRRLKIEEDLKAAHSIACDAAA